MFRGRSAASAALLWARSRGRDRDRTDRLFLRQGTKTTKRFLGGLCAFVIIRRETILDAS